MLATRDPVFASDVISSTPGPFSTRLCASGGLLDAFPFGLCGRSRRARRRDGSLRWRRRHAGQRCRERRLDGWHERQRQQRWKQRRCEQQWRKQRKRRQRRPRVHRRLPFQSAVLRRPVLRPAGRPLPLRHLRQRLRVEQSRLRERPVRAGPLRQGGTDVPDRPDVLRNELLHRRPDLLRGRRGARHRTEMPHAHVVAADVPDGVPGVPVVRKPVRRFRRRRSAADEGPPLQKDTPGAWPTPLLGLFAP